MLMHLADLQDLQPTTVIFAANREHELAGAKAIRELQSALPKLRGIVTVWYPQGSSSGLTGTAADAFAAALDNMPELPDVYVCGPTALRAVRGSPHTEA